MFYLNLKWNRFTYAFLFCISMGSFSKSFIDQFLLPGDLVFDIGAHIGKKTELYRSFGARVISVEPQPDCIQVLRNKFRNDSYVSIVPKGLSFQQGKMKMHICSKANTISTLSEEWMSQGRFFEHGYVWDKIIEIDVTTLDDLIQLYGYPRYCKIDVENYEYEVLCGMSRLVPYISFEFAREFFDSTVKCLNRLTFLGYDFFNIALNEEANFVFDSWVSRDKITDFIVNSSDKELWGDIYACNKNTAN